MNSFSKVLTRAAGTLVAVIATLTAAYGQTTTWLSFSGNPVLTNDSVTVNAGLTVAPGASLTSNTGTLVLEKYLVNGIHSSCSIPGGFYAKVAASTTGSLSYAADTSIPGSFGYQSRLYSTAGNTQSACIDLVVGNAPTCGGAQIGVTQVFGATQPVPGTYNGGFQVTVRNCGPSVVKNVKAQGGTSGWTTVTGIDSGNVGTFGVSVKTGGTQVITWYLGDMQPGASATMTVGLTGQINAGTPAGTVLTLAGAWSVTGGSQTNPLTITVVNP